jgi:hypothetical protein
MKKEEKIPLKITNDEHEDYNWTFTMMEMEGALKDCKGSSLGTDEIHYKIFKNATTEGKSKILKLYNKTWQKGEFPESWRKALAIPIAKPGKDPKNPNNYRTIQLTNCMCKVERMINKRLC